MRSMHLQSGGRYPVLRSIGILYLVMAGLSIVVGLITAGYILASQPWNIWSRVVWAIVSLAGTCFAVIGCLAIAEVLKLIMDIEHNTRIAAMRGFSENAMSMASSPASMSAGNGGETNRMREMDEETAEGALVRGH